MQWGEHSPTPDQRSSNSEWPVLKMGYEISFSGEMLVRSPADCVGDTTAPRPAGPSHPGSVCHRVNNHRDPHRGRVNGAVHRRSELTTGRNRFYDRLTYPLLSAPLSV